MTFLRKQTDLIFLSGMSLVGIALVFLATSTYGGGVAGDSVHYLSAAENLLRGQGFVDYQGGPLIWFPPLFSILLAGLAAPFGWDVFIVGWTLNTLLMGVNVFLSGLFLRKVFQQRPLYFYLSVLFIAFSTSMVKLHAAVFTDPLFLTFTLLFFMAGERYLEKQTWASFVAMLVLAILAPLLRYSGFSQIVAGGLIILLAHGKRLTKSLPLALAFGVVTFLPIALWIYLHNYLPYGTFWGTSNLANADALVNFLQALRKMMYWFIPYRPITPNGLIEPVVVLLLMIVFLAAVNRKAGWLAWAREFLRPAMLSMLIFTVVYFTSSTLNIATLDHKVLASDRYYVIIMLPALILIFTMLDDLVLPHLHWRTEYIQWGLVAVFLVWSLYPASKLYKYVSASRENGEQGYNIYNTRAFSSSALLTQAKAILARDPTVHLYSNLSPMVWFYTRHFMQTLPVRQAGWTRDEIKTHFAGWPDDKPGYMLWFEPDEYKLFYPPDALALFADIKLLSKTTEGAIYSVSPRSLP